MAMDKRYQVFVSSTYSDLRAERSAIIQALMQMDCIPAGMELFPAADEEQFEFIKRIIDDCDYYILIIAGRYGSTAPDGVSYTEKEYDYAREKGIPVLRFVHSNPESIEVGKRDADPEIIARLKHFRDKVTADKLAKMWSEPKELPGLVAISLSRTIKTHPAVGWVRGDQVASAQLLTETNELRKRNAALEGKIREMEPVVTDIAGLNDSFELSGEYQAADSRHPYLRKLKVTWGELFGTIAPDILGCPNELLMESSFKSRLQDLFRERIGERSCSWHVRDQDYETAKIQFKALNLVTVEMQPTLNGGSALFWSLTSLGESTLLQLRTVRSGGTRSNEPSAT
jgi:hypothetical protein